MVRYIALLLLWWLVCGACLAQTDAEFKVRRENGEKGAATNRVNVDTILPAYKAPLLRRASQTGNEPIQIYWYQWPLKTVDSVHVAVVKQAGKLLIAAEPKNNWQQGKVLTFKMYVTINGVMQKFMSTTEYLTADMQKAIADITAGSTILICDVTCRKTGASPDMLLLGPFLIHVIP